MLPPLSMFDPATKEAMRRLAQNMGGDEVQDSTDHNLLPDRAEFITMVHGKPTYARQKEFETQPPYTLLPPRFQQTAMNTAGASASRDKRFQGENQAPPSRGHYGGPLEEDPRLRGLPRGDPSLYPYEAGVNVPIAEMDRHRAWEEAHPTLERLPPNEMPRTIRTDRAGSRDPFTIMHEYGHGAWYKDLTPNERAQWDKMHDADAALAAKGRPAPGFVENWPEQGHGWHSFASALAAYSLDPDRFRARYPRYAVFFEAVGRKRTP